jgi:hypothetical protein
MWWCVCACRPCLPACCTSTLNTCNLLLPPPRRKAAEEEAPDPEQIARDMERLELIKQKR